MNQPLASFQISNSIQNLLDTVFHSIPKTNQHLAHQRRTYRQATLRGWGRYPDSGNRACLATSVSASKIGAPLFAGAVGGKAAEARASKIHEVAVWHTVGVAS